MGEEDDEFSLARIKQQLGFADDEQGTFVGLPEDNDLLSGDPRRLILISEVWLFYLLYLFVYFFPLLHLNWSNIINYFNIFIDDSHWFSFPPAGKKVKDDDTASIVTTKTEVPPAPVMKLPEIQKPFQPGMSPEHLNDRYMVSFITCKKVFLRYGLYIWCLTDMPFLQLICYGFSTVIFAKRVSIRYYSFYILSLYRKC